VTLRNQGAVPLVFRGTGIEIVGPDAAAFQVVNYPATTPLGPSQSRDIQIAYSPSVSGAHEAYLRIETDDTRHCPMLAPLRGAAAVVKPTVWIGR
jgi:hypothetical protein